MASLAVVGGEWPDAPPELREIRKRGKVGFAWFSDTVLLYAEDDTDQACKDVLAATGSLIFMSLTGRTRVRAGVSYGSFHADPENEIFVGEALVDAYELEQDQNWSGGALTPAAAARIPEIKSTGQRYEWWTCDYAVSTKSGASITKAIDWTQGIHQHGSMPPKWSRERDEPNSEDEEKNPALVSKWRNTKEFHESVCVSCFPGNKERDPLKVM